MTPDRVIGEVRQATRALRAAPGYVITAVFILAVSIAASTAIFAIVDAVVLRDLPFPDAHRLVAVGERVTDRIDDELRDRVAPQNFIDWREQQNVFSGFAAIAGAELTLVRDGKQDPKQVVAQRVSADFFTVLGVQPALGRPLVSADEAAGAAPVAVISHRLWQRRFGGSPEVVGRMLRTRLRDFAIVGVMPREFEYPVAAPDATDAWVPYAIPPDERVRANDYGYYLDVIARLKEGVTLEQAQDQMTAITAGLAARWPRWFEHRRAIVEPLGDWSAAPVRRWMLMLLAAVACVMLIACLNVANLVVLRTIDRARDLAVRAALGASGVAICRTVLTENLLISGAGVSLGLTAAWAAVTTLRTVMPTDVPHVARTAIDARALGVAMTIAVAVSAVLATGPLVQWLRPSFWRGLLQREHHATVSVAAPLRSALLIGEVALAVVLLVGSGLFAASFWRVASVDLGLDRRHVVAVRVRPSTSPEDPPALVARRREQMKAIAESIRRLPSVADAALLSGGLPLRGDLQTVNIAIPGRALPPDTDIAFNQVSPEYFGVLRVGLLRGRHFTTADTREAPAVVILNDAAAHRYFDNADPVGRVVQIAGIRTIVGIVADMRQDGPEQPVRTQAFIPYAQGRAAGATIVVRTMSGPPPIDAIRRAVWSEFPDLALTDLFTLEHYFDTLVARRRMNMLLLGVFGLFGLVIATLGVYAAMAYLVATKRYEIGVRVALGAAPATVYRSIVARALGHLVPGALIGTLVARSLLHLVRGFLFELEADETMVFSTVIVGLILTGVIAASIPGRRAARVDPVSVLRLQ